MTAPTGPAKSPDSNGESSSPEHDGFIYDNATTDSETPEYEASYEPEREFVLMPLFRRIGKLLGIGKTESEHIYVPEPSSEDTHAAMPVEPGPLRSVEAPSYYEISEFEQSAAEHEARAETTDDDVLGIESPVASEPVTFHTQQRFEPQPELPISLRQELPKPEPAMPEQVPAIESEPQIAFEPVSFDTQEHFQSQHELPVSVQRELVEPERGIPEELPVAESEPEPQIVMSAATPVVAEQYETVAQPQFEVAPLPPVLKSEPARPQPAARLLTQDDINALMASIREAAASISLALSQAAEWLHKKEEDILRRAEATATAISHTEKPGPQLVEKHPRVPFWKRIDWEKEFTPGRAALLGALAMAILMVIGISLARRPASSVLPQETHAIQPGGVTVTAHPASAKAPSAQTHRPATVPAHSAAPVTRRARTQANEEEGPEVVTHYYNKAKPSPAHQSTIAGVRHYSDMQ